MFVCGIQHTKTDFNCQLVFVIIYIIAVVDISLLKTSTVGILANIVAQFKSISTKMYDIPNPFQAATTTFERRVLG